MILRSILAWLCIICFSCSKHTKIVETAFTDSLMLNYRPSQQLITAEEDLFFWKQRLDNQSHDLVNLQKYAQALLTRFHLKGDINDLVKSDSLFSLLNRFYKGKEPGILLTMAGNKMLRHEFTAAQDYIDSARMIIPENVGAKLTWSDAQLEKGNAATAAMILSSTRLPDDYGYNFRLSKLEHYNGSFDSSLNHMLKAAALATSPYMKQAALSNAADLYLHEGKIEKAYEIYMRCLRLNHSDFHSLAGIGWISAVYEHDLKSANRIFRFINERHHSPDGLWRLIQINEVDNPDKAKEYAVEFMGKVNSAAYGNLFAKYLITLYTGLANHPAKAAALAEMELANRATPQTYAWLSWTLLCNGEEGKAYEIYKQKVSGKPLEALELFWMGKLMKHMKKNKTAKAYFEAALKNKYDLSPAQLKDLEHNL
jgi:tetratricopeptide (TPR) repeat protein